MLAFLKSVSIFCFGASYFLALVFELWHYLRPRPIQRYVAIVFGGAGLLAHLFYLTVQPVPLRSAAGSLLMLALILAIFYLYGAVHHRGFAWGLFVLPVVVGLVVLAAMQPVDLVDSDPSVWRQIFRGDQFWQTVHGTLLLLASVGVCVGFVASMMYFVQMYRLRAKLPPEPGKKMMSLERLEAMNRRAILWAFPLLTVGLIVGVVLQFNKGNPAGLGEYSTMGLWIVFAVLLYLRYGVHVRGRQVAFLTTIAFVLLLLALFYSHGGDL